MPKKHQSLRELLISLFSGRDSTRSLPHDSDSYRLCREPQKHSERPSEEEDEKIEKIAKAVRTILECVGEDPGREGLRATLERYAKAMLYFTKGYSENIFDRANGAIFHEDYKGLIVVRDIDIYSLCEHHLVPFTGKVQIPSSSLRKDTNITRQMHIGYIPDGRILGLSKMAHLAEVFSRRLQVQERLTEQVAIAVFNVLKPQGVGVVMESSHLCMVMRGVQKVRSTTTTSYMVGSMQSNPKAREEFLTLLHLR